MGTEDVELSFEDLTFGAEDKNNLSIEKIDEVPEPIDNDNVVLITSPYGSKVPLAWHQVLTRVAEICGPIKSENFREKQTFGFIQFFNQATVQKAIEQLQDVEFEGFSISAEVCDRITPGRDPRTHDSNSDFKNSTLIFKNLPFQLKQEKLEEMLNQFEWKPQNVSYLYDGSGMFRGMAFVKYKEIEAAQKVFQAMNDLDINGRKLRIEYKRKVKEAEAPTDDDNKKIMEQLTNFGNNTSMSELAFPCSTSFQRKQIHHIAEKLGLGHYSTGEGENKFVIVKKKDESQVGSAPKSQPIKGRRNSDAKFKGSPKEEDFKMGSYERSAARSMPKSFERGFERGSTPIKSPPNSFGKSPSSFSNYMKSPPAQNSFLSPHSFGVKSPPGANPGSYKASSLGTSLGTSPRKIPIFKTANDAPTLSPARQPKGPDGSNGFSSEYRDLRNKSK